MRKTVLISVIFLAVRAAAASAQDGGLPWTTSVLDYEAAFVYQGLTLRPDEPAELELTLINQGLKGDTFDLELTEVPAGWTVEIRRFNRVLSGLFVAGEETASLTLAAFPPDQAAAAPEGAYPFAVKIVSRLGQKTVECRTTLIVDADRGLDEETVTIGASYPEIGGPSDGRFSFALDVRNNGPEDALISLSAEPPQDWEASFKPGYEEKQISSIHVPAGQSRSVTLDLAPGYQAEPGLYVVKAAAAQPAGRAETELKVNLTGTYKIRAAAAGELLSTSTEVGRPVTVTLFVVNDGSAPQKEINFLAVKPDNWKVEFQPEKLVNLPPRGNPVQVDMTVTPAPNALVGDYGLGLNVQGEKAQAALDFRVTVKAGAAWAWLGAAIIVLAVLSLALTFRRLGRR
ncbi:MAG: hypothetical protein LBU12_06665 [Deltaproteobacteria bacterium]|jgi:uncharacterized membrane protein|nr:hypothetical protein [Deltaproteobacteria bacterium]